MEPLHRKENVRCLFGHALEVGPFSSRFVRSAKHIDADVELNANVGVKVSFNGKAKSETNVNIEGWEQLEGQLAPRL